LGFTCCNEAVEARSLRTAVLPKSKTKSADSPKSPGARGSHPLDRVHLFCSILTCKTHQIVYRQAPPKPVGAFGGVEAGKRNTRIGKKVDTTGWLAGP